MNCPNCGARELPDNLQHRLGRWDCGSTSRGLSDDCVRRAVAGLRQRIEDLERRLEAAERREGE